MDGPPVVRAAGCLARGLGEKSAMPGGFGLSALDTPARPAAKQPDRADQLPLVCTVSFVPGECDGACVRCVLRVLVPVASGQPPAKGGRTSITAPSWSVNDSLAARRTGAASTRKDDLARTSGSRRPGFRLATTPLS